MVQNLVDVHEFTACPCKKAIINNNTHGKYRRRRRKKYSSPVAALTQLIIGGCKDVSMRWQWEATERSHCAPSTKQEALLQNDGGDWHPFYYMRCLVKSPTTTFRICQMGIINLTGLRSKWGKCGENIYNWIHFCVWPYKLKELWIVKCER